MTVENSTSDLTAADRSSGRAAAGALGEDHALKAGLLSTWMHMLVGHVRSDCPDLTNRQMALLLIVYLVDEQHTVRSLASQLDVAKPVISRALDALGTMSYLRRRRGVRDRRDIFVERTPEGSTFLAAFASLMNGPTVATKPSALAPPTA